MPHGHPAARRAPDDLSASARAHSRLCSATAVRPFHPSHHPPGSRYATTPHSSPRARAAARRPRRPKMRGWPLSAREDQAARGGVTAITSPVVAAPHPHPGRQASALPRRAACSRR
eukprot:scaffold4463_cov367-Prasinococcus_capsulatus_cf.AAC.2